MTCMYRLNGDVYSDPYNVAHEITDNMEDCYYDEMLNEVYGEVNICGYTYNAADALYRLDETAYRCGKNDYYDSLASDIGDEINWMDDGDTKKFYGFEVECFYDFTDDFVKIKEKGAEIGADVKFSGDICSVEFPSARISFDFEDLDDLSDAMSEVALCDEDKPYSAKLQELADYIYELA